MSRKLAILAVVSLCVAVSPTSFVTQAGLPREVDYSDVPARPQELNPPSLNSSTQDAPPEVSAVTLTPPSPVGIQTVAFDVQFSRPMNTITNPQVSAVNYADLWTARGYRRERRRGLAAVAASNGKVYAIGGATGGPTVEEYDPAKGTWRIRANMPTAQSWLGAAAASNGKIYAIGGVGGGTVQEYDPATDTWTTCSAMPTPRAGLGVATASNGKIYAIGGVGGGSTVEEYDPATDTWRTRADMPTARSELGVVAASNGKIYAMGGELLDGYTIISTVEEYDPATDTWTTRADMPAPRFKLGVAAASNGKIYAIGGFNYLNWPWRNVRTVEEYDPATDTWTTRADMPPPGRYDLGVTAASNGKIYAIDGAWMIGNEFAGWYSLIEEYDPATDTWTRAGLPTAQAELGAATASNGKIYAVGGLKFDPCYIGCGYKTLAAVDEYDPATDAWRTRADMPTARRGLGVAAASNGKLYAVGGRDREENIMATVEEYDPATDAWRPRAAMPTARAGLGVAAASNGKIYAIGGHDSSISLGTVEEYDPATDAWRTRASMPTVRSYVGVAAASNGKIYVIGGRDNSFIRLGTVEEYDPATDTWRTRANMPTARDSLGVAAASNGKLYAIGGHDGSNPLAIVEEYDPATDTWRTRASMTTARSGLGVAATSNGKLYAVGGDYFEETTIPTELRDFYEGQWLSDTRYHTQYDFSTLTPRGTYTLTVSGARGADGVEMTPYSGITFTVDYAGAINDTTPPAAPSVWADLCRASTTSAAARWSASDPDSAIDQYRYALGMTPGGTEVLSWTKTLTPSVTLADLSLVSGRRYYISVKARNRGGLWSTASSASFTAGVPCSQVYLPLNQGAGTFAWSQSNTSGFGSSQNQAILSLAPFGGQLYAGTYNPFGGSGAQLWRTSVGGSWSPVITNGLGITRNVGLDHLIEFKSRLYASTWADDVNGGEVWRSSTGDNGDWQRVVSSGFGDATNGEVFRFGVLSDTLYASTWSYTTLHGSQLYRTTTGNVGDWTRVVPNGFGDANNSVILSFETFQGHLYAGTNNLVSGGEVWRTENGVTWTQVNADGFGAAAYPQVSALAAFNGYLYASTTGTSGVTGASVWRCGVCDGSDWAKVVDNGLGNVNTREQNALQVYGGRLYFLAGNSATGLEAWQTQDGVAWEQVGLAGLGDRQNVMTNWGNSTMVFDSSLYVGTWNLMAGGQVCKFGRVMDTGTHLPITR